MRLEYRFVSADHLDALYATMHKQEEAIRVLREVLERHMKREISPYSAEGALDEADKILNGDSQNPDPSNI